MAGIKIVDLPALGRDLLSTDLLEMSIGGTASRKITGQEIMNASKLNVGATPIVSGTVGRLLFQGTGNVLQQSSSLFWDSTNNRLGIGTSTPTRTLEVNGETMLRDAVTLSNTGDRGRVTWGGGYFSFQALGSEGLSFMLPSNARVISIPNATGNVLINTTTDAGFRLDVNGTARVVNALTLGNVVLSLSSQGGGTISCANSAGANTGSFINLSGPVYLNPTAGNSGMFAITGQYASSSGTANFNHLNLAPTLNTTGTYSGIVRGIYYNPTLTSVTGVTHRAIDLTSGDFVWGTGYSQYYGNSIEGFIQFNTSGSTTQLWMRPAGNQNNYGTSYYSKISHTNADLTINSGQYGSLYLGANGGSGANTSMVLFNAAANTPAYVLINTTTNAGYRLDVNGTARIVNSITANSFIASNNGSSFMIGGTNAMDYGDGLRIAYSGGSQKVTIFTNSGTPRLQVVNSGSILIGTTTEIASSLVTMESTTRGFLPPRMTNAQRTAIVSPAVGLIVYCTDVTEGLWVYKSTGWTFIV